MPAALQMLAQAFLGSVTWPLLPVEGKTLRRQLADLGQQLPVFALVDQLPQPPGLRSSCSFGLASVGALETALTAQLPIALAIALALLTAFLLEHAGLAQAAAIDALTSAAQLAIGAAIALALFAKFFFHLAGPPQFAAVLRLGDRRQSDERDRQ
jgi:hypothetical protein